MKIISKGISRHKPEEIIVLWLKKETFNRRRLFKLLCDLCNNEIDWNPFPVIDLPSDKELADPDYVPSGGNAFCRSCAANEYGLKDNDAGKVKRLWACFNLRKID